MSHGFFGTRESASAWKYVMVDAMAPRATRRVAWMFPRPWLETKNHAVAEGCRDD